MVDVGVGDVDPTAPARTEAVVCLRAATVTIVAVAFHFEVGHRDIRYAVICSWTGRRITDARCVDVEAEASFPVTRPAACHAVEHPVRRGEVDDVVLGGVLDDVRWAGAICVRPAGCRAVVCYCGLFDRDDRGAGSRLVKVHIGIRVSSGRHIVGVSPDHGRWSTRAGEPRTGVGPI